MTLSDYTLPVVYVSQIQTSNSRPQLSSPAKKLASSQPACFLASVDQAPDSERAPCLIDHSRPPCPPWGRTRGGLHGLLPSWCPSVHRKSVRRGPNARLFCRRALHRPPFIRACVPLSNNEELMRGPCLQWYCDFLRVSCKGPMFQGKIHLYFCEQLI